MFNFPDPLEKLRYGAGEKSMAQLWFSSLEKRICRLLVSVRCDVLLLTTNRFPINRHGTRCLPSRRGSLGKKKKKKRNESEGKVENIPVLESSCHVSRLRNETQDCFFIRTFYRTNKLCELRIAILIFRKIKFCALVLPISFFTFDSSRKIDLFNVLSSSGSFLLNNFLCRKILCPW